MPNLKREENLSRHNTAKQIEYMYESIEKLKTTFYVDTAVADRALASAENIRKEIVKLEATL